MSNHFEHPSCIIDQGAKVGEGTKVWHFSHIMKDVIIGKNCNIGQNVFIGNNVRIGDRVKIQNNVSLYDGIVCEDDVFIGPSAVFTNVKNPRSFINRKDEYLPTILGKGCTIGANATILCGIKMGDYSFVGAGSVLTKSIRKYELIIGNPGRFGGWVSEAGCLLNFDEDNVAVCPNSGSEYILYSDNEVIKKN